GAKQAGQPGFLDCASEQLARILEPQKSRVMIADAHPVEGRLLGCGERLLVLWMLERERLVRLFRFLEVLLFARGLCALPSGLRGERLVLLPSLLEPRLGRCPLGLRRLAGDLSAFVRRSDAA